MVIGFIGAGNMAQALIEGVVGSGLVPPTSVIVTNRSKDDRPRYLAGSWGVRVTRDMGEVARSAGLLILAVKPQDAAAVLSELREHIKPPKILISVAAGIPISAVKSQLPDGVEVIRAMPNTSCAVKESATAIATAPGISQRVIETAKAVFGSVGKVVVVSEKDIDAVTGLSGSGPAHVYYMIEALVEAGAVQGLSRLRARKLFAHSLRHSENA